MKLNELERQFLKCNKYLPTAKYEIAVGNSIIKEVVYYATSKKDAIDFISRLAICKALNVDELKKYVNVEMIQKDLNSSILIQYTI